MEDRKVSLLAFGVGGLAIGGFWMARPSTNHSRLRVLEQQNLSEKGIGLDDDAAAYFRVRLPSGRGDLTNDLVIYRVVDRRGNVYPLSPMTASGFYGAWKLSRGYPTPIEEPRIQAVSAGEVVASERIDDLPEPTKRPLTPQPHPLLSLIYHDGWLEVRPRVKIPKNERWRVIAKRTPYTTVRDVSAVLPTRMSRRPSSWLRIPYESRSEAVEVEVQRFRLHETSEVVKIPGFELQKRYSATALVVKEPRLITSRLGLTVRVPRQYTGPYRVGRHFDPRIATASVNLDFGSETPKSDDPLPEHSASLDILAPQPIELGLRELRVGPGVLRSELPKDAPLREGEFEITARVKAYTPVLFQRVQAVLPIERGKSAASIWDRYGLGRGN